MKKHLAYTPPTPPLVSLVGLKTRRPRRRPSSEEPNSPFPASFLGRTV